MLGYAIVVLDAYDAGENFLPDFLRSLAGAMLVTLLFGGQVVLVMAVEGNYSAAMRLLLLATVTTAITLQVFTDPLQMVMDRLMLRRSPHLGAERSQLRAVTNAIPRLNNALDVTTMDEEEF